MSEQASDDCDIDIVILLYWDIVSFDSKTKPDDAAEIGDDI